MKELQHHIDQMPQQLTTYVHKTTPNYNPPYTTLTTVSDHNMFGCKAYGLTVLSWNMLNPSSPISPGFSAYPLNGIYVIHPAQRLHHLELSAQYIIEAFLKGADAICLQEVPSPNEEYFEYFFNYLIQMALSNSVLLNFNAFMESILLTGKKNPSKLPHFATAILLKQDMMITSVNELDTERGAIYVINNNLTIENHHGDYIHADKLVSHLSNSLLSTDAHILLGDGNIPLTEQPTIQKVKQIEGYFIEPTTNNEHTQAKHRTLDFICTNDKQAKFFIPSLAKVNNHATTPTSASLFQSSALMFTPPASRPPLNEETNMKSVNIPFEQK